MAKFTRILSIDGGGIRAIIPAQILTALEKKLKQRSGNVDTRLADHFDMIAGTGTGGILTCLYLAPQANESGHPRFAAEEAAGLLLKKGPEIYDVPFFHRMRSFGSRDEKYPAQGLEKVLDHYFGKLNLSELLKPCLVPAYDITRREGKFFTQHDARLRPHFDFRVRDVARATSAAPTYFECAEIEALDNVIYPLIDGGVFANNPALCAYAEAHKLFRRAEAGNAWGTAADLVVFSLGTGKVNTPYAYKRVKDWGVGNWAQPMYHIAASGAAETVDYQLRQLFDAAGVPGQYVRLDPEIPLTNSSEMDDASEANLRDLRVLGNETAGEQDHLLERVADLLLAE